MDLGLKGKVAVVLAASSGIGRGIAMVLAQEGCSLAICARDFLRLNTVAESIRSSTKTEVFAQQCDVSNSVSLDDFFDSVLNTGDLAFSISCQLKDLPLTVIIPSKSFAVEVSSMETFALRSVD